MKERPPCSHLDALEIQALGGHVRGNQNILLAWDKREKRERRWGGEQCMLPSEEAP